MTQNISKVTTHHPKKPNLYRQFGIFLNIIFRERRLPGRCYQIYYGLLRALGFKKITIRVARGVRLKGVTDSLGMAQEVWSKRVYDHPGFTLGKDMSVIDIGANQGFYTVYAASLGANVYAFEPSSDNYSMLEYNVSTNDCGDRSKLCHAAVSGQPGVVTLFVGLNSNGDSRSGSPSILNENRGGVETKSETVDALTFEGIIEDNKIEFCDFLKMDCEGAEYDILSSIPSKVFRRIGRISMETHGGRGHEAYAILKSNGFEILEFEDRQAGFIKARNLNPDVS